MLNDLNFSLAGVDLNLMSHDDFDDLLLRICDQNAPLKMKYVRGNDQPFCDKRSKKRAHEADQTSKQISKKSMLQSPKKKSNLIITEISNHSGVTLNHYFLINVL